MQEASIELFDGVDARSNGREDVSVLCFTGLPALSFLGFMYSFRGWLALFCLGSLSNMRLGLALGGRNRMTDMLCM